MYRMVMLAFVFVCTLYGASHSQEERNPFATGSSRGKPALQEAVEPAKKVHPLLRNPVLDYTLKGVIISPEYRIALIETDTGMPNFCRVGDKLGRNGGVIASINESNVQVREGKKIEILKIKVGRYEEE
ncbi:MAG: pilus assembly protein PilP [Desulfobacterales bacterium]|jgi:Tfp pilus assembly protein PilP|nr:pilus assembly protein PilP [Desulfobacterales bacterium]MDP6807539.1 pilus assembly protein PilP [Desulfobacterales bacterium]|tara:strand:+ start:4505 stop:4891 length:387 start_codon:yes stop_codon:yes gene_type:complete